MQKTILKFGLISGVLCALMMAATLPLEGRVGFDHSYFVGYTLIVLSFLLVFFGIRSYRESSSGQITFGKAFAVGISITLITCVFYIAAWEVIYFNFMPDYMDKYSAYMVAKAQASGASPAAIQAQVAELKKAKDLYNNNIFYNVGMTFLEPFPVGLLITLISAGILRKRKQPESLPSPLPASN
jgi:hypothetical protein